MGAGLCTGLCGIVGLWVACWDLAIWCGGRCVGSGRFSPLVVLPSQGARAHQTSLTVWIYCACIFATKALDDLGKRGGSLLSRVAVELVDGYVARTDTFAHFRPGKED